jgi:hypothetical protein
MERTWSGGIFVENEIPPSCPGAEACGATCRRGVQAPEGTYGVAVDVGVSASGCAADPCACEPSEGACTIPDFGAMVDEPLMPVEATFSYPDETTVELVIE